jgi:photosynthetic reaction center cytochrome c subunit
MTVGLSRTILGALGTAAICLLGASLASSQTAPPQATPAQKTESVKKAVAAAATPGGKPLMAEQAFKNVKVLKGLSANEFMDTMGFFSASLVETCTFCHSDESDGDWKHYADETPKKALARKMILMEDSINKTHFDGQRLVTCYSCHNGNERPKVIPSLANQYVTPPDENPDTIAKQTPNAPPADQFIDKYLDAIGGAQKVAAITSYVAKGNYEGFSATEKGTVEIDAKAPTQRGTIFHTDSGDTTTAFDGRSGWFAAPNDLAPIPVMPLTGGDLDGARVDAAMSFPAQIKTSLTKWRTGIPETIGDEDVDVVQGISPLGLPVKLYFDSKTNLLVRVVRYIDTVVGRNPVQIDYSNYRDVSGIKMPFHQVMTWTDGRSTLDLTDIQLNAPIDDAKFAKPAPPALMGAPKAGGQ